ncbi:Endonuclease YhcR precursor [compost metagenome]
MSRPWRTKLLGFMLAAVLAVGSVAGFVPDVQAAEAEGNVSLQGSSSEGISAELVSAQSALSVAQAIAKGNNGETVTVTGYIAGHATGSLTANFQSPFANDYNLLIADSPGEQDKSKLVDVQLPTSFRASFGLQSNPGLLGKKVIVSGSLAAYNNFSGLKSVTAIELVENGSGGNPDPDPGSGEPPALPDGTGKKVLFDNSHAQTAGAADWVIEGAFSDFAEGLRSAGFTVSSLERPIPYTFGEAPITYSALSDYDVFVIPEANIPFKASEQAALVQYVQNGGAVFFISDHYNADRNKNRWDSSEVFNGYRRGAYENPAKGMSTEESNSPAMQGISSSDWLADNFGVRFRYNALGDVNANDIVAPSQAFGITTGVDSVAVHAGSTLAILDPNKAKGIVYVPTGVSAWGNAVDSGVYNGGGRAEGPYAAIAKLGLGKAAFIGDSSPVEDATPKYVREENGAKKTTYDGFKEVDDGLFLVQTVKWLAYDESYTSLSEVPGLQLDTPTSIGAAELPANTTEPQPEPWAAPAAGYKWYDPNTFKPGSYGSTGIVAVDPVYNFVHQSQLPSSEEFQIRLTVDGLNPGQSVSALKVGIYLSGGTQIARFKNSSGSWSDYNYSPEFSLTANALGHASIDLTVQLKPGQSGAANLRLKQGSANVITKSVTIANVSAEPLPGDTGGVPQLTSIANARQAADGTVVTVEGVVTSQPGVFGGQGFYVQDATGGIYVFQTAAGYQAGDVLKISATKTLYNGEVELENPVVIEKTGTLPLPMAELQEAVNDNNQGRLITLQNVQIQGYAQASPAGSFEFNALREDGSSTRIRIDGRTGVSYAEFSSLYPEGVKVSISGISSIFKGTYQLKPLSLNHVAANVSDITAPVTVAEVIGKTGQAEYNTQDVSISFIASDDGGSGLSGTEYRVNGGEWTNLSALTLSENGKYAVEFRSEDKAGNVEESKIIYINIDRAAPEIVVEGETNHVLQTLEKLPFSIVVSDQISGVQQTVYKLDGKQISSMLEITPLSWSVGKHTLIVTSEDQAGNSGSVSVTFEVTIDIDHLDELISLGEANKFIYKKGTLKSLQATVSSLQKAKSNKERQLKISALKIVIRAFEGKGITRDFTKQLLDDLNYISKNIA